MISEKTIQICGKDVQMRYCAAAETGYERLSGQSSDIFVPEVERDDEGNITNVKQHQVRKQNSYQDIISLVPK